PTGALTFVEGFDDAVTSRSLAALWGPGRLYARSEPSLYVCRGHELRGARPADRRPANISLPVWRGSADEHPAGRGREDHHPRRQTPEHQQTEHADREAEVGATADRAVPHRVVERREQQSDHGGVDAPQGVLKRGALSQALPEGERAHHQEERWKK